MTPKHLTIAQEMLGLSPFDMAHALGVNTETFSEWQSGRQAVPSKVCRCLELLLLHPKTARRLANQRNEISRAGTIRRLLAATPVRASDADKAELGQPGMYAIFVDRAATLGPQLGNVLLQRKTCLLYIGVASKSLRIRLVKQDLRGKVRSTFFQSIGAVWGYRPPAASLNRASARYKFDASVTEEIADRIRNHLHVRWITDLRGVSLEEAERYALREHKPILNIRHNPSPSPELKKLRADCRRVARSAREVDATAAAA